jgi:hypothetical protein
VAWRSSRPGLAWPGRNLVALQFMEGFLACSLSRAQWYREEELQHQAICTTRALGREKEGRLRPLNLVQQGCWQGCCGLIVNLEAVQGVLVRYIGQLRANTAAQTDERVRLTGEAINGVLAAKMMGESPARACCWEPPADCSWSAGICRGLTLRRLPEGVRTKGQQLCRTSFAHLSLPRSRAWRLPRCTLLMCL